MSTLFENAKIITEAEGKTKVIENGYLGVEGKYIDYVGSDKPEKQYSEHKDMSGRLLMPGLVNCHTHTAMNLLKGIGSDLPLNDWLHTVWPIEDKMRAQELLSGMEMAILEMLAGGITLFSDMYMMPDITQKAVGESGIKANMTSVMMNMSESTDYMTFRRRINSLRLYKEYNGAYDDRLRIDWSLHGEYTINEEFAELWADEIQQLGGRLHIHLSETRDEQEGCIARHGKTPAKWFADLGFFNIPTYAAHCVWLTDEDIEILKTKNVTVVHNPTSNMKLGSGFARIPLIVSKGINTALGTDGSASNNNLNMFEEMHLASVIHKGFNCDPTLMTPDSVMKMATVNGAHALGREDTGVLIKGKKADIIALRLDVPHMLPDNDTQALTVYSAQAADVTMTMADGRILYENGEYLTMDKERIFRSFTDSCRYLSQH